MGFIKDAVGGLFGSAADAAEDAAAAKVGGQQNAIGTQNEFLDKSLKFLENFQLAGDTTITGLTDLVNNPEAQKDFITDNAFFDSLADKASSTLFANQAAKGKVGSGGTAGALQDKIFQIGSQLLNQDIQNKLGLVGVGQNAANNAAGLTSSAGSNISNLKAGIGETQAAGILGASNAKINALNTTASAIALSDIRAKECIRRVGYLDNGLPVYTFRYKGDAQVHMNVMAQEAEVKIPDSVFEMDGLKYVNMEKVVRV